MPYTWCSKAFELVEQFDCLCTSGEVMDAVQRALDQFGFEYFFYTTLPRPDQGFDDAILAIREPPELITMNRERQYIKHSPALRHCRRMIHPFAWKSAPYDRDREPLAVEWVTAVADFGLAGGIMVPIHRPAGCQGGVWFGGQRHDPALHDMPTLQVLALYSFDRIYNLEKQASDTRYADLTAREREVLTWAALGKSAWEIGEILGIAKRTVDEHSQTAMHKLGAVNRTQAVAVALRDRLIAI
jgi:LuxR family transcriptional regulator, quorum-sensing system regulator BjaR1